jgi:hypothetical protein
MTGYVDVVADRLPDGTIVRWRYVIRSISKNPYAPDAGKAENLEIAPEAEIHPSGDSQKDGFPASGKTSRLEKNNRNKEEIPLTPASGGTWEDSQPEKGSRSPTPAAPEEVGGAGATFFDMVAKYPPGHMLSRPETERAWRQLTVAERQAAIDGVPWYLQDCANQKPFPRKIRDLKRYLRGKLWEGAKAATSATNAAIPILGGTPQAGALLEHERAAGRSTAYIESCWREGKPYYARSEWPPGYREPSAWQPPAPKRTVGV